MHVNNWSIFCTSVIIYLFLMFLFFFIPFFLLWVFKHFFIVPNFFFRLLEKNLKEELLILKLCDVIFLKFTSISHRYDSKTGNINWKSEKRRFVYIKDSNSGQIDNSRWPYPPSQRTQSPSVLSFPYIYSTNLSSIPDPFHRVSIR